MPTRYLKAGIRDSEKIDALSFPAEILFYRLLVTVDDFGRYDGRPAMVKAACFPIKDSINNKKTDELMLELAEQGLIFVYKSEGKPYLQIAAWDNKPRASHSKYPEFTDECIQVYTTVCNPHASVPLTKTETKTETKTKTETETETSGRPDITSLAKQALDHLNKKTGSHYKPIAANLRLISSRLQEGHSLDELIQVVDEKAEEWGKSRKMEKYLRPSTLFGAEKFNQYVGQLGKRSMRDREVEDWLGEEKIIEGCMQ